MPIIFETRSDPARGDLELNITIPMDQELMDQPFMIESHGRPSAVQLLTFLLEKAQEKENGKN